MQRQLTVTVGILLAVAVYCLPARADDCSQAQFNIDVAKDADHDLRAYIAEGDTREAHISAQVAFHALTTAQTYSCDDITVNLAWQHEVRQVVVDARDGGLISKTQAHNILLSYGIDDTRPTTVLESTPPPAASDSSNGKATLADYCKRHPDDPVCK